MTESERFLITIREENNYTFQQSSIQYNYRGDTIIREEEVPMFMHSVLVFYIITGIQHTFII